MSRILNGDKLIRSARLRTMAPDDTKIFTDDDILDILNEEMDVQLLDKLLELHAEHLTISVTLPRTSDNRYTIPYRAVGNKLREVSLMTGSTSYELTQVSISELTDFTYFDNSTNKFYIESDQIVLINPNQDYNEIKMWFALRPNVITKEKDAGIISSIIVDDIAGTVTLNLSQINKAFTTSKLYDIIGARTPNKIRAFDLAPVSVTLSSTSGFVVFNKTDIETILDDLKVGDYLTLAEQTPVPNIPTEMHPLLAQLAAIHILESLGDTEALNNAQARAEKLKTSVQFLVDDRVDFAPIKIKPRHSTLKQMVRYNRKRY